MIKQLAGVAAIGTVSAVALAQTPAQASRQTAALDNRSLQIVHFRNRGTAFGRSYWKCGMICSVNTFM